MMHRCSTQLQPAPVSILSSSLKRSPAVGVKPTLASTPRPYLLPRTLLTAAYSQQRDALATTPSGSLGQSKRVMLVDKIAACVAANDAVGRFETAAGRAAMIGFAVAFVAELLLPRHGLFGSWSGSELSTFSLAAAAAIGCSALMAAISKRQLGGKLQEAVFASMTALKRSRSSISHLDVDSAVDSVLESVFSRDVVASFFDEDEWI